MDSLKFTELREANMRRVRRWHPTGLDEWTLSDWGVAAGGEMGEMLNVIKKLNRERDGLTGNGEVPPEGLMQMLADEIADIIIYLDLLAAKVGVNLGVAIREKFNKTSVKVGFPERL